MKLEERLERDVRSGRVSRCPESLQGVGKDRIRAVLRKVGRENDNIVDAVFALLDTRSSFFSEKKAAGFRFCDGAATAHIACHIGIIQREKGKLDREGRDYWLKPMWEIGAFEKVYFDSNTGTFLQGHPKAKSGNSAYRLEAEFAKILRAPEDKWEAMLAEWMSASQTRKRQALQAEMEKASAAAIDNKHLDLIRACCEHYQPNFLPGYEVLYIDASDGARVTPEQKAKLREAGVDLTLHDSMPDVLLWNRKTDWLWVIEAVCSDGEVDLHKMENIQRLAERAGKAGVGFTTAYPDWKTAARRQATVKNLAMDSFLWIREYGAKQFRVLAPATQGP